MAPTCPRFGVNSREGFESRNFRKGSAKEHIEVRRVGIISRSLLPVALPCSRFGVTGRGLYRRRFRNKAETIKRSAKRA